MTTDELITEAARRGAEAGSLARSMWNAYAEDESDELPEWSPLSGEWAGESIPELLGDLLEGMSTYAAESITGAYESAALNAYYGEEE